MRSRIRLHRNGGRTNYIAAGWLVPCQNHIGLVPIDFASRLPLTLDPMYPLPRWLLRLLLVTARPASLLLGRAIWCLRSDFTGRGALQSLCGTCIIHGQAAQSQIFDLRHAVGEWPADLEAL